MSAFRKNHRFNSPARLTPVVVLGAFFLAATSAEATWYSRQTGNWDDVNTWSTTACGGAVAANVPQVDGDVQVCNGHTVTVRTTTNSVDTVTVNNGGILNMESTSAPSTGILVAQESITVEATGTFNFNESNDARPELRADAAGVALDGTFCVSGLAGALLSGSNGACSFAVRAGATVWFGGPLTNETTIVVNGGSLTFGGSTTNNGIMVVNSGRLTFGGGVNDGTIIANGGFIMFSGGGPNNALGTLSAVGGTTTFRRELANHRRDPPRGVHINYYDTRIS